MTEPVPRPRRAGLSAEQQLAIIDLYSRRGATLRSVAAEVYVCPSTVANVLIANGIPRRPQGGSRPTLTTEQLLEVGELYAQGHTQAEIAEKVGISRTNVLYRLRRLDGYRRTRSQSARLAWDRRKGRAALWTSGP